MYYWKSCCCMKNSNAAEVLFSLKWIRCRESRGKKGASCCGHLIRAVQDLLFAPGSALWEGSTVPTTALQLWVLSQSHCRLGSSSRAVYPHGGKSFQEHWGKPWFMFAGVCWEAQHLSSPPLHLFLVLLAKSFTHALPWKPTHPAHQYHLPVLQLCIFLPDSSCCSPSASSSAFHLPALPSYWIPTSSLLWQCCLSKAFMFQDVPFPALQPNVTSTCISVWRLHWHSSLHYPAATRGVWEFFSSWLMFLLLSWLSVLGLAI